MAVLIGASEWTGPLTPDRVAWIEHLLKQNHVSTVGAEQFTRTQPVTNPQDRQQLLNILNRLVRQESHGKKHGKG